MNKKIRAFQKQCSRIKALISFRSITTWAEVFSELGGTQYLSDVETPRLEDQPTGIKFNEIAKIIELRLALDGDLEVGLKKILAKSQEVLRDIANDPIPTWNDSDFLLETPIPPPIESRGLKRRRELELLIPPRDPKQIGECLYFQRDTALEFFEAFTQKNYLACMLRANTGDGKTYFAAQQLKWLQDSGHFNRQSISPWKVLYVTGASIVDQTIEVLEEFGLDCLNEIHVLNYESLRAKFGTSRFLSKKLVILRGEEFEEWQWNPLTHPVFIVWDECHKLKNERSIQSQISHAANNIKYIHPVTQKPAFIQQLFMSASPFSRVFHAKSFAVATKKPIATGYGGNRIITNENWKSIARQITHPHDPNDYSKLAMKKFLREFKDYIFTFKNVRRKFRAILRSEIIQFSSPEDAQRYKVLWDNFVEFKKRLEGKEYSTSRFLVLVQLGVFRAGAELIRAPEIARRMYRDWLEGYAPVCAIGFKATGAKILMELTQRYKIPRDKISMIWGGSAAYAKLGSGPKMSKEEIFAVLGEAIKNPGKIDIKKIKAIHQQLKAEADGLGDIPKELDLGIQTKDARNRERKKFQSGASEFCIFTFGAGKEGLSLHQNTDKLRPRKQYNTPTYNEMEMLQAEGRTARITSLSDTEIITLLYANTIEVPVLRRVLEKRGCLDIVMSHGVVKDETNEQYEKELAEVCKLAGMADSEEEDEDIESEANQWNEIEKEMEDEE